MVFKLNFQVKDSETNPPHLSKEFLDIQATIGCRFTLKHVRDKTITYS